MARADDDVQSWLSSLPFKMKRELAATIKEQADGLADAIKAKAPRKTGALAGSVKVRRKRNELDLEVTAGGDATTKEIRTGSGTDYDYAMATEFGTSKEPAQPFFYNTAREMMPQIRQAIEDKVGEVTSRESGVFSPGNIAFGTSLARIVVKGTINAYFGTNVTSSPIVKYDLLGGILSMTKE